MPMTKPLFAIITLRLSDSFDPGALGALCITPPQPLLRLRASFDLSMTKEPMGVFGSLLAVCINDGSARERLGLAEGTALFLLGVGSSLLTVVVLSSLGLAV